jgi:hypothetical protein
MTNEAMNLTFLICFVAYKTKDKNDFSGSFPSEIGMLTNLVEIDIGKRMKSDKYALTSCYPKNSNFQT